MPLQWHKTGQNYEIASLGVKMDKNVYKYRKPPYKIGRVGISAYFF